MFARAPLHARRTVHLTWYKSAATVAAAAAAAKQVCDCHRHLYLYSALSPVAYREQTNAQAQVADGARLVALLALVSLPCLARKTMDANATVRSRAHSARRLQAPDQLLRIGAKFGLAQPHCADSN